MSREDDRCESCRHESHRPGYCMYGYSTFHPDDHCACVATEPARAEAPQLSPDPIPGLPSPPRVEPSPRAPIPAKNCPHRTPAGCFCPPGTHTPLAPEDTMGIDAPHELAVRLPPDRTEAPQGETPPGAVCNVPYFDLNNGGGYCGLPLPCSAHPVAQPETGDAARVREIVKLGLQRWANGGTTQQGIELAAREALRAGRVAENEACDRAIDALIPAPSRFVDTHGTIRRCALEDAKGAIAARRGRTP